MWLLAGLRRQRFTWLGLAFGCWRYVCWLEAGFVIWIELSSSDKFRGWLLVPDLVVRRVSLFSSAGICGWLLVSDWSFAGLRLSSLFDPGLAVGCCVIFGWLVNVFAILIEFCKL